MMTAQIVCKNCGSGIHVYPSEEADKIACDVCQYKQPVHFNKGHELGLLHICPNCQRSDFYAQKDFNRQLGALLFSLAAIVSTVLLVLDINPLWYLSTFITLYLIDFFLFRRLQPVAICYNCEAVFRQVKNIDEIQGFDHERHDRIVYSGQNFHGKPLDQEAK